MDANTQYDIEREKISSKTTMKTDCSSAAYQPPQEIMLKKADLKVYPNEAILNWRLLKICQRWHLISKNNSK